MAVDAPFPLKVEAQLEPGLSRWLWLVKWFLAIPHLIVLSFLWVAYVVLTVIAFFAILFTGRYPRSIFEFNVGVLRWSWRVADYCFGVLATDRYPPFSLAADPAYPASLEVEYPERLSRGLVLVKWILAIPHLVIVAILAGGGGWFAWDAGRLQTPVGGDLIGLLAVIAAVVLAVTGSYPRGLFDLIVGLNRWVLRVVAYTGLMTDRYPPFRLDMGGAEPGGDAVVPHHPDAGPAAIPPIPVPPTPRPAGTGWTGARVTAVVIGAVLGLTSLGPLAGGGALLWAARTQRDGKGFISTTEQHFKTDSYAITSGTDVGWIALNPGSVGSIRVQVTSAKGPVFVGIAPTADVAAYLTGVARSKVVDLARPAYETTPGAAPSKAPGARGFWTESSAGTGAQSVTWEIQGGAWTIVVMNADGSKGIDVLASAGAKIPALLWIATGLLIFGGLLLMAGVCLIAIPVRRASRRT